MINNELLIKQLVNQENTAKKEVEKILQNTNSEIFKTLSDFWKSFNRDTAIEKMYNEFKENIESFWINPKYNKDLKQIFNMTLFSHSGVYGGGLESFAINFKHNSTKFPDIEIMDNRFEHLENISSLEAFIIYPLYDFTMKIQGEEDNFDDWDDLMAMYSLYESTALILAHKVFEKVNDKRIIQSNFNLKFPFYMSISEHDSGTPDKIVYLISN